MGGHLAHFAHTDPLCTLIGLQSHHLALCPITKAGRNYQYPIEQVSKLGLKEELVPPGDSQKEWDLWQSLSLHLHISMYSKNSQNWTPR